MAAGVVTHGRLLVLGKRGEVAEDLLDRAGGPFGPFEGFGRIVDVGLVMQVVVDPHRLRVDMRLERVVRVREVGQLQRHRSLLCRLTREDMLPPLSPVTGMRGARCRPLRSSSRRSRLASFAPRCTSWTASRGRLSRRTTSSTRAMWGSGTRS